jgi:hypothetical protein
MTGSCFRRLRICSTGRIAIESHIVIVYFDILKWLQLLFVIQTNPHANQVHRFDGPRYRPRSLQLPGNSPAPVAHAHERINPDPQE